MVNITKTSKHASRVGLNQARGFTLIEILIVMTIMATLLSLVAPRYFESLQRSKEQALHHDLSVMREAIDQFYSDKGVYPDSLDELVQKKYLRALPQDPITQSPATWLLVAPENPESKGAVFDIHSGAQGLASDGTVYAEW